jgi:hypothetical protein
MVAAVIRGRQDRTDQTDDPFPADSARVDRTKASIDIPAAERNSIRAPNRVDRW